MSILNNYKRNITSLFINKSEYYDYCINRGEINANKINKRFILGQCFCIIPILIGCLIT